MERFEERTLKIGDMVTYIYQDLGVGIILDLPHLFVSHQLALILWPDKQGLRYTDIQDLNIIEGCNDNKEKRK